MNPADFLLVALVALAFALLSVRAVRRSRRTVSQLVGASR